MASVPPEGEDEAPSGAKRNRRAPQSSPGFESESQEELNPQTILECGSGSESRGRRDPANVRGQPRGPNGRTGPSTRRTALQADSADQSSDKSALGLQIALKFKKGHKRKPSRSRSNSKERRKRPSGQSVSEDTVPSSEESVFHEQPKLPSSATQDITPKPSGAGSTYTKQTMGDDVEPLGNRRPLGKILCLACPSGAHLTGGTTGAGPGHTWMPPTGTRPSKCRVLTLNWWPV